MSRHDMRNTYPFHNPRANVRCCIPRSEMRASLFVRVMRALLGIKV